jgi:hypothetical protein
MRHVLINGRIEFFDFANREITPIHSLEKPASDFGVWPYLRMANTFSVAKQTPMIPTTCW